MEVTKTQPGFNYGALASALAAKRETTFQKIEDIANALYVDPIVLESGIDRLKSGSEFVILPQNSNSPIGTSDEIKWTGLLRPVGIKIFMNFLSNEFPFIVETFSCRIPNPSRDLEKLSDDLARAVNQDAMKLKQLVFKPQDFKSELERVYNGELKAIILLRSENIKDAPLIIGALNIEKYRDLPRAEEFQEYVEQGPSRPEHFYQFGRWAYYLWYWYF